MNKIFTLLIFALFLGMSSSHAQTVRLKDIKKAADQSMVEKNYYAAWQYYKLALTQKGIKKDSTKTIFNMANAARMFKAYDVAGEAYKQVLSRDKKGDYPLTEFWLGRVYHSQGEYNQAIDHYQNYIGSGHLSKKSLAELAIVNCQWAGDQIKREGFIMDSLKYLNTIATEFAPVENKSSIYYSALSYNNEENCGDIDTVATRIGISSGLKRSTSPIVWTASEKGKFVAHTTFNRDETKMFFTICERINAAEFQCEIYFRGKKDNGVSWDEKAVRLSDAVNLKGTTSTQPNIGFETRVIKGDTVKQELLFFVSNRADSLGGQNGDLNIYRSEIGEGGNVSAPVKLNINSDEDEVTPFYDSYNETLYFSSKVYFSSNDHRGFGGYDIYSSKKEGSLYGTPKVLTQPFNSSYDDYYYSVDEELKSVYLSTNRLGVKYEEKGLETCCDDIYLFEKIKVNLEVITFNTRTYDKGEGLNGCEVSLYDITDPNNKILVGGKPKYHANNNFFAFQLELERDYVVESIKKDTINGDHRWTTDISDVISTKGIEADTTIKKELLHTPDIIWEVYTFERPDGYPELAITPLGGCTLGLTSSNSADIVVSQEEKNSLYTTKLEFGKNYRIEANKDDYITPLITELEKFNNDGNELNVKTLGTSRTDLITTPETITDSVYLTFDDAKVAAVIYFENDFPKRISDKRNWNGYTNDPNLLKLASRDKTYQDLFNEYTSASNINSIYKPENAKYIPGSKDVIGSTEAEVDSFFNEVKNGKEILDTKYLALLEKYVERANKKGPDFHYYIPVKGYASPKSNPAYNEKLGYRRIDIFVRYLKKHEAASDALKAALPDDVNSKNSLFIFEFISYGDETIEGTKEDQDIAFLRKLRNKHPLATYHVEAAKRRKVVFGSPEKESIEDRIENR